MLNLLSSSPIQFHGFCPCQISILNTNEPGSKSINSTQFNACKCSSMEQVTYLPAKMSKLVLNTIRGSTSLLSQVAPIHKKA
jgi:hypothetical protein